MLSDAAGLLASMLQTGSIAAAALMQVSYI
jgi:hypothetical protein